MAFGVGVAAALEERGVALPLAAGASSGSLTAAAVAAGRARELFTLFSGLAGRSIVSFRRIAHNRSIFDMSHLVRSSLEEFFGEGDLRAAPGEAVCTAARFPDFALRVFSSRQEPRFIEPMLGSCFFPILYGRPIRWRGDWLLDGGILDNVPMDPLVARGATTLYVVVPNADGRARRSLRQKAWHPVHTSATVRVIAPDRPLRLKSWELDRERVAEALAAGRRAGEGLVVS